MLLFGQHSQAVLHDDDGSIHDQSKVDGPQTHQVSADFHLHHAGRRHQHRQRNRKRRDERRPQISQ